MKKLSTGLVCVFALLAITMLPGCGRPAGPDILSTGASLYSQHDEERLIRHFFKDERNGVFLDVGCWDWKEGSTTLSLEERLGWSGLAVDAQDQVRAGYEQHRPRTRFFNYLVTDSSDGVGQLYVADQISSVHADHVEQFGVQWYQEAPLPVPTITLNDLLARNGVTKVDLLSMDIEGAEPAALAGFEIERYRPRLVVIEISEQTAPRLLDYFTRHGYHRIDDYLSRDAVNWYFAPGRAQALGG